MKSLNTLLAKHPDKVRGWYKDSDGYWINLMPGWQFWEAHSVHEWNVKDALASFKQIEPCTCADCAKGLKQ